MYRVGVVGRDAVSSRDHANHASIEDPDCLCATGNAVHTILRHMAGLGTAIPDSLRPITTRTLTTATWDKSDGIQVEPGCTVSYPAAPQSFTENKTLRPSLDAPDADPMFSVFALISPA
ncbi:hypothetical protein NRB_06230 [Novosphingobium sp. 11B]